MNQNTYGDFLRQVDFFKILKILTNMWAEDNISGQIQNLGWTQLEYTLKIMRVGIENVSFGYELISEMWISEGPGLAAGGSPEI